MEPRSACRFRRLDARVQLVDLDDERVDAADGVLSPLLELADALVALVEARAERLVLGAERAMARDELEHGALQALELGRLAIVDGLRGDSVGENAGRLMRELGNGPAPRYEIEGIRPQ